MRKVVCDIRRSELHTQRGDFAVWEIPILRLIHRDQVTELDTIDADNRVLDPAEEYARLERRYGLDKETHVPRVAMVYGGPPLGVQRLAEAMKEELERQAELDGGRPDVDADPLPAEDENAERGRKTRKRA